MRKNGFTLMELLAVVVILGITFLFIMPSVTSLMGLGERREIELIEERVLSAAKEYVNNYDSTFYNSFYKEGDTNYVYKSKLLESGLINEEDVSKLDTFIGVKGELLSNDRIKYTLEYINAESNEYSNEELYFMMQNMLNEMNELKSDININKDDINSLTSGINNNKNNIDEIKDNVSNLTNKDNIDNIFLKNYPVGSIYVTTDSTNPGTKFGGTWVTYGAGRTLVGVDSSQTEFASVGLTGGEKTHTLIIDEMPSHAHSLPAHVYTWGQQSGLNNPVTATNYSAIAGYPSGNYLVTDQGKWTITYENGSSKSHNNLQPYITVYMWKRTA